ncbi:hypothetical protein Apa02nite_010720 [Actinoplanes palleronii]|uniref:YjeF N-terminal domain-containing protein n=1 Tax=Actinoplanes palleronii TaxID=113570 RepID=A0ABQ4B2S3_9ACTN|nr:hypothetical protein Apa02nite_010720 [Actinoplanes palleronii]
MAGRMISGTAALADLVRPASEVDAPGAHRMLPVADELGKLLPGGGLRRGSTVAVAGGRAGRASGGTSLMLALLAAASRAGSWCAVVGLPALGALAAAETGIALERLALIPDPGPDWPTVVAALIDGVDVVVTAVPGPVSASIASRLGARARQRGSVLMPFGAWSGADVTLQVSRGQWEGLGDGRGRLRRREVTVVANGRGAAARPRELTFWMPGLTALPGSTPAARPGTPRPGSDAAPRPGSGAAPRPGSGAVPVRSGLSRSAADAAPVRSGSPRSGVDVALVRSGLSRSGADAAVIRSGLSRSGAGKAGFSAEERARDEARPGRAGGSGPWPMGGRGGGSVARPAGGRKRCEVAAAESVVGIRVAEVWAAGAPVPVTSGEG